MLSMSWRMVRLLTDKYENDTLEDRKNDMAEEADLAETAPLIVCDSLVKIYKTKEVEVLALQGLDLTVNRGELMAIIGKSGSGKKYAYEYRWRSGSAIRRTDHRGRAESGGIYRASDGAVPEETDRGFVWAEERTESVSVSDFAGKY